MEGFDLFEGDDDLEVKKTEVEAFNPPPREDGWFMATGLEESRLTGRQKMEHLKYVADYSYLKKDYSKAASNYYASLQLSDEEGFRTVIRDNLENLSRCCIKIDRFCDAIYYAERLVGEYSGEHEVMSSVSNLLDVKLWCGLYASALEECGQLVTAHPISFRGWSRLAYCLAQLSGVVMPCTMTLLPLPRVKVVRRCACDFDRCLVRCSDGSVQDFQTLNLKVDSILCVYFCILMSRKCLEREALDRPDSPLSRNEKQIQETTKDIDKNLTPESSAFLDSIVTAKFNTARWNINKKLPDKLLDGREPNVEKNILSQHLVGVNFSSFCQEWFDDLLDAAV